MQRFLATFLLVLALAGSSIHAQQVCSDAQNAQAKICFQNYLNNYNLPSITFQNFINARVDYFGRTGKDGFRKSCTWQTALNQCLSNINLDLCFTTQSYSNWFGTTLDDSYSFHSFFFMTKYECGDAEGAIENNFDCIREAETKNAANMTNCWTSYSNRGTTGVDVCKSYDMFVSCIDDAYVSVCGEGIRQYVCNLAEIGFEANFSGCNTVLQQCKSAFSKFGLTALILVFLRNIFI
ncbi:unnamed protein product [Caenorhabditis auriculariae]|uniref:DUF19 domain-containing protein n=1 Tax=Caenorhabditis auriculariae TaxID=2777116 RepID=A0A8S1HDM4_9PELO|nr:unnamed protein product [Caenorhabditis auriculariae]